MTSPLKPARGWLGILLFNLAFVNIPLLARWFWFWLWRFAVPSRGSFFSMFLANNYKETKVLNIQIRRANVTLFQHSRQLEPYCTELSSGAAGESSKSQNKRARKEKKIPFQAKASRLE